MDMGVSTSTPTNSYHVYVLIGKYMSFSNLCVL